jgi:hypothetical protein
MSNVNACYLLMEITRPLPLTFAFVSFERVITTYLANQHTETGETCISVYLKLIEQNIPLGWSAKFLQTFSDYLCLLYVMEAGFYNSKGLLKALHFYLISFWTVPSDI